MIQNDYIWLENWWGRKIKNSFIIRMNEKFRSKLLLLHEVTKKEASSSNC